LGKINAHSVNFWQKSKLICVDCGTGILPVLIVVKKQKLVFFPEVDKENKF